MTPASEQAPVPDRRAELARNLAAVRARIAAACTAAGRDPAGITLIAVTKTWPASDVLVLAGLGLTDFGENRDQEAARKAVEVAVARAAAGPSAAGDGDGAGAGTAARTAVTWHFIGQLQTNKAHSVARYADVVHSVDRVRLVRALGTAARSAGRQLTGLVQVSLDGDPARGGVSGGQLAPVAEAIEAEPGLVLGGVMAVAPLGADPWLAFDQLRSAAATVLSVNPAATVISAGMSGDLEAAVHNGATHLRIGTALLGNRRLPVL